MQPVDIVSGRAIPLGLDNVDTDVILPGRFLKTITRTGLGVAAFETIRAEPGNVFNRPDLVGAPILIAGRNFGCGSSREHAVWAMLDMGIRAVVAESYSDIFSGNAFKNGLLTVALPGPAVAMLLDRAQSQRMTIDLAAQTIVLADGDRIAFAMDPFRKDCLLKGLDEIGLTLNLAPEIAAFETRRVADAPWADMP
jgi:3-isopropylmalate/(R)-2-methylmalate dehydratase small subunit